MVEKQKLSADTMVDWLQEATGELVGAHAVLDFFGVPRINPAPDGVEFTLAARITYALDPATNQTQEAVADPKPGLSPTCNEGGTEHE